MSFQKNNWFSGIKVLTLTLFFCTGALTYSQLPCSQNIDFNTWSQEGDLASGIWNVTNGGSTVEQNLNGSSTWFVSPNDFFNVIIQGTIEVNTTTDDDIVGFVFGYQNPIGPLTAPTNTYIKTLFFDWKQTTQTFVGLTSNEGFALYEMDGFFDFTNVVTQGTGVIHPPMWERVNTPIVSVLDTDYGNNGWNDFQQYSFQLKYTADSIVIWIDNQKIFEESGCFEPGKFGFYNQSQDAVIYSNFSYNFAYDFSVSDTILCVNDTAFFEIGSGCLNYFPPTNVFDWDFGDNSTTIGIDPSHVYTAPGNYTIELISSDPFGCADTALQNLQVFEYPVSDAGINDTTCTLTYNLSAAPSNGVWSGPSSVTFSSQNSANAQVNVPAEGLYSFIWEVTNAGGCSSFDTVTILFNTLDVTATITEPLCNNENTGEILLSVQGGNGSYSYQWGINSNNQTTNPAVNLAAGSHSVTVIDGLGCSTNSTFLINEPQELVINQVTNVSVCDGDSVTLNAVVSGGTAPYSYLWGNGIGAIQNPSFAVFQSNVYPITITDLNGCTAEDSASVTLFGTPQASFIVDTLFACLKPGQVFTFYNTSTPQGVPTSWDFGDQSFATGDTVTHVYSSPGTYAVNLTIGNTSSCFDSYTLPNAIEIYPSPTANFSFAPNPVTVLNSTVNFMDLSIDNINVWNWFFDELETSTEQNPTFTFPKVSGTYNITLEVENIFGCTDSVVKQLIIRDDISIFAPNTFTPDGDEFNQNWVVYANGVDLFDIEITIFNRWGEVIWQSFDINTPWDGTYNGKLVPNGVYSWTIRTKSISNDEKFEFVGHVNVIR